MRRRRLRQDRLVPLHGHAPGRRRGHSRPPASTRSSPVPYRGRNCAPTATTDGDRRTLGARSERSTSGRAATCFQVGGKGAGDGPPRSASPTELHPGRCESRPRRRRRAPASGLQRREPGNPTRCPGDPQQRRRRELRPGPGRSTATTTRVISTLDCDDGNPDIRPGNQRSPATTSTRTATGRTPDFASLRIQYDNAGVWPGGRYRFLTLRFAKLPAGTTAAHRVPRPRVPQGGTSSGASTKRTRELQLRSDPSRPAAARSGAKVVFEIQLTGPKPIGQVVRFTTRNGKAPRRAATRASARAQEARGAAGDGRHDRERP